MHQVVYRNTGYYLLALVADGMTTVIRLDILNNIRLSTLLEDSTARGRVKAVYKLEEMSDEENLIVQSLEIMDFHNNRLTFRGVGVYI